MKFVAAGANPLARGPGRRAKATPLPHNTRPSARPLTAARAYFAALAWAEPVFNSLSISTSSFTISTEASFCTRLVLSQVS